VTPSETDGCWVHRVAKGGGGMNPIQAVRDWSKKREFKAALLARARQLKPGQGIDLRPWDPLEAVSVQELVREHPQLTVVRMKDSFTLCIRSQVDGALSDTMKDSMTRVGAIVKPGDELFHG